MPLERPTPTRQASRQTAWTALALQTPSERASANTLVINSFHPGYLTAERLAKAKKLKIAITAGIGSDHVDLNAANKTNGGITVAEVTGSNVVSVAEHVVMTILTLVRNFVPAHEQIVKGEWNVAEVAKNEYDLENKVVGTVAVGRIGERVLRRLKAFDCKELLYFDYQPLSGDKEKEIGCRRVDSLEEMLAQCDVVTINCPLHEKTRGLFNKDLISKMKKGSWLVNTARGAIVVKEDVAQALKDGHLRGYGGDVWFPQPAPKDHPLRYAQNPWGGGNAMVPHMSGTSIDAQKVSLTQLLSLTYYPFTNYYLSGTPTALRLSSTSTSPAARTTGPRTSSSTKATTPPRRTASAPRRSRPRRLLECFVQHFQTNFLAGSRASGGIPSLLLYMNIST
jgi:formate dehydrogenase